MIFVTLKTKIFPIVSEFHYPEQPRDGELDPFDLKILDTVMEDGRISITELSEKVGLSKPPVTARFNAWWRRVSFSASGPCSIPRSSVSVTLHFAEVKLTDTREDALREFNRAIR